jgi:chemotaxis signal transduction protein
MTGEKRPGLLLRVDGALLFVPASIAATVTTRTRITRVAGAPAELLGIVLHEGHVVPVVAIGESSDTSADSNGRTHGTMVICSYLGEPIALVGGEVVQSGVTDAEGATPIDFPAIYARIQAGGWSTRWGA